MSKYTTQVRFICEAKSGLLGSADEPDVKKVLDKSWKNIFESFPIFDESYRKPLCVKILRHYYMREICAESVGLWLFWLNNKMNEIMPLYNQYYESALLEFDPLHDVDKTITRKGNVTTDNSANTNTSVSGNSYGNSDSVNKFSDTPQGGISGLQDGSYLTNASITNNSNNASYNDNNSTQTSGTVNSTDDYLERVTGKQGTENYSDMLNKFRSTFLNIDMMIIEDLADLFMSVW